MKLIDILKNIIFLRDVENMVQVKVEICDKSRELPNGIIPTEIYPIPAKIFNTFILDYIQEIPAEVIPYLDKDDCYFYFEPGEDNKIIYTIFVEI